jgi:rifampicin phosphotransferase
MRLKPGFIRAPQLKVQALQPLLQLRRSSAGFCGSKAATLGDIEQQRRSGHITDIAPVPDGFCVPYAHYAHFMQGDEVRKLIQTALATPRFERSRLVRREALETLRRQLLEVKANAQDTAHWVAAWKTQLKGAGVFVRSSSNSEDLPHWSGAGLFTTVPHVTREADVIRAVQTVWASVFNFEAFEARRYAGIAHDQVFMGVFVQLALDSVVSGVMITRDPFDAQHANAVYISAKRGLGIKVVEGRRVAEQWMWDAFSGAARRLSHSDEDSALQLDSQGGGGVVESSIRTGQEVLTSANVRQLSLVGQRLKQLFKGVDQDIEWAINKEGRLVLLQSRPYVSGKF